MKWRFLLAGLLGLWITSAQSQMISGGQSLNSGGAVGGKLSISTTPTAGTTSGGNAALNITIPPYACVNSTSNYCSAINVYQTATNWTVQNNGFNYVTHLNVNGTINQIWEGERHDVYVDPGTTIGAEVNALHGFIWNQGTLSAQAEAFEASIYNSGTVSGTLYHYYSLFDNKSTGTTSGMVGLRGVYNNENPAAGSIGNWTLVQCDGFQGGGGTPANFSYCIANNDPASELMTVGHIAFRKTTQPVLSGCGTSPSLDTYASDTMGTITEGSTATGCTLTFNKTFVVSGNSWTPHCMVTPHNGSPTPTGVTPSMTNLVITNASGSGYQYDYFCGGSL